MYYSITEAVGTGSAVLVAVPPYILKAHIRVYVDGLPTEAFDWVNAQTISVVAALNRTIRVVRRTSPDERLTRFLNGVPLPGETLEVDSKQAFFLAQEAYDLTLASGGSLGQNLGPGVELTTEGIKQLLAGQITPSLLEQQLRQEIGLVAADTTVAGSPAWRVAQEAAARAAALVAEAQARNTALLNEAAERGAAIQAETVERQGAIESLSNQLVTLTASLNGANAGVHSEMTARVNADDALGQRIDLVSASTSDNSAAITAEANARANADNAIATAVEEVKAELEGADADMDARITSVESAYVAADEANAAAIQTVKSSVDDGLTPRVAAVEISASTFASKLGTVESNYSLKVQARADGKFAFAGIGLVASAGGAAPTQSEMVFAADKFTFVPSMADVDAVPQPLLVMGLVNGANSLVVPASRYGDKLIQARMVVDGAIETRHLKVTGGPGAVINADPGCADPSAWTVERGSITSVTVLDAPAGATAFRTNGSTHFRSRDLTLVQGRSYRVTARARKVSGGGTLWLRVLQYDSAGAIVSYNIGFDGISIGSTWGHYTATMTVTAATRRSTLTVDTDYLGSGVMELQDLRVEELIDSALIVEGGIKADRIDTRGLTVKDAAGNIILGAGTGLPLSYLPLAATISENVCEATLSSPTSTYNGAGVVSLSYPDFRGVATAIVVAVPNTGSYLHWRVLNRRGRAPGWYRISLKLLVVSGMAVVVAATDGATWESGSGYAVATTDSSTPVWVTVMVKQYMGPTSPGIDFVVGASHNPNNPANSIPTNGVAICDMQVIADESVDKYNRIAPGNASTYIANAAIDLAHINRASIGSLSAITATIGTLRTATGGARTEIYDNVIKVYDSSNILRVKLGNLNL